MLRTKPFAALAGLLVAAFSIINMDKVCCSASSHKKLAPHTTKSLAKTIYAPSTASAAMVPFTLPWDANSQGSFIMSMTGDRAGHIWVGTEDQGVWRFDRSAPAGKQWTQFNSKNGLGDDNCYALTCDRLGRVWAGTLNHGVSVFNGKDWRTYGPLDGPLGSRVFALTTSPRDGDVWMSTEAGLARYSLTKNIWSYYTRAEGLPSDQAQALAFDHHGNLFVGTDCDGIAIGSPADNFKSWRVVPGPATLPNSEQGEGLPSGLINTLLVAHDGTIYAGTTTGLATSDDDGETWQFQRGADWQDKLAGLYHPVAPIQKRSDTKPLLEDYITALAEDSKNQIWIGHRTKGYEVFLNNDARAVPYSKDTIASDYTEALFPLSTGQVLLGKYGGGLTWVEASTGNQIASSAPSLHIVQQEAKLATIRPDIAPLPASAKPPTLSEINVMLAQLAHIPMLSSADFQVEALDDDWVTQGTWIDHYGNFAALLCAMNGGGFDQFRGYRGAWVDRHGWIGRNGGSGDALRHWVTWIRTDDPRSLQNMLYGGRKQSEWDDHGETKPMTIDGPDVYGTFKVPKGRYIISCYDFNKDGQDGNNRWRDYVVDVRPTPMPDEVFHALGLPDKDADAAFDQAPVSAKSRIHNFRGGVWKRFYKNMPQDGYLTMRVRRNYSFNTILCGIFLDPVGKLFGPLGPDLSPAPSRVSIINSNVASSSAGLNKKPSGDLSYASLALMDKLLVLKDADPTWYTADSRRYLLPLLRRMLLPDTTGQVLAAQLEKSKYYDGLRQDVAACLNDTQMFDRRDQVFYNPENYNTWAWQSVTELAEKDNWDSSKYLRLPPADDSLFHLFLQAHEAKQTWK